MIKICCIFYFLFKSVREWHRCACMHNGSLFQDYCVMMQLTDSDLLHWWNVVFLSHDSPQGSRTVSVILTADLINLIVMLHKGCQDTINKGFLLDMYIFYTFQNIDFRRGGMVSDFVKRHVRSLSYINSQNIIRMHKCKCWQFNEMLCRSHQVIAVFLWKVFDSLTLWLFSQFGIINSLLSKKNPNPNQKTNQSTAWPFPLIEKWPACRQCLSPLV